MILFYFIIIIDHLTYSEFGIVVFQWCCSLAHKLCILKSKKVSEFSINRKKYCNELNKNNTFLLTNSSPDTHKIHYLCLLPCFPNLLFNYKFYKESETIIKDRWLFKGFKLASFIFPFILYLKDSLFDVAVVDPCTLTLSVTSTIFPAVVQSVSPGELHTKH